MFDDTLSGLIALAFVFLLGYFVRGLACAAAKEPPTPPDPTEERARISLAACVIYCCGHSMTGGQGVGDPNVYGVLFLRCRYCRREICIEGAPEVATAPGREAR
jgi:hypothetical protein